MGRSLHSKVIWPLTDCSVDLIKRTISTVLTIANLTYGTNKALTRYGMSRLSVKPFLVLKLSSSRKSSCQCRQLVQSVQLASSVLVRATITPISVVWHFNASANEFSLLRLSLIINQSGFIAKGNPCLTANRFKSPDWPRSATCCYRLQYLIWSSACGKITDPSMNTNSCQMLPMHSFSRLVASCVVFSQMTTDSAWLVMACVRFTRPSNSLCIL